MQITRKMFNELYLELTEISIIRLCIGCPRYVPLNMLGRQNINRTLIHELSTVFCCNQAHKDRCHFQGKIV